MLILKTMVFVSLVLLISCSSTSDMKLVQKSLLQIEVEERAGVRYHKQGDYKNAFKKLSASAKWGMKQPQYLLGVMFLKGQHVEQSIEIGMGWLGVANEVDIKEWRDLYDGIYNKLSTQQKIAVDEKVELYVNQYGIKAQNLSCVRGDTIYSAKIRIYCQLRTDGIRQLYDIEGTPESIKVDAGVTK
jgi:hypothetical protein